MENPTYKIQVRYAVECVKQLLHRMGLRQRISEVQLERYGRLLFHAPNQFQNDAALSDWFRPHFVQELVNEGIITIMESSIRAATTVGKRPSGFQFAYY